MTFLIQKKQWPCWWSLIRCSVCIFILLLAFVPSYSSYPFSYCSLSFDALWQMKALEFLTESKTTFGWETAGLRTVVFEPVTVLKKKQFNLLSWSLWSHSRLRVIVSTMLVIFPCDSASAQVPFCSSPICLPLLPDRVPKFTLRLG